MCHSAPHWTGVQDDHPKTDKVLDRRNWLDIAPVGTAYGAPASWRTEAGALVMTLRVEDPDNQQAAPALYPTIVPRFQANIKGEAGWLLCSCALLCLRSAAWLETRRLTRPQENVGWQLLCRCKV